MLTDDEFQQLNEELFKAIGDACDAARYLVPNDTRTDVELTFTRDDGVSITISFPARNELAFTLHVPADEIVARVDRGEHL